MCQCGNGFPKWCGQQWPGTGQGEVSNMAVPLPWHCRPLVVVEAVRCHCSTLALIGSTRRPVGISHCSGHAPHWDTVLIPMLLLVGHGPPLGHSPPRIGEGEDAGKQGMRYPLPFEAVQTGQTSLWVSGYSILMADLANNPARLHRLKNRLPTCCFTISLSLSLEMLPGSLSTQSVSCSAPSGIWWLWTKVTSPTAGMVQGQMKGDRSWMLSTLRTCQNVLCWCRVCTGVMRV